MNKITPADEAAIEATKAPLMAHLIELRQRLIWSLLAFVLCFLVCFYFSRPIYAFLTEPLANVLKSDPGQHMIATGLTETFFTYVKVAMFAGLCLAFPFIAAQVWIYVAPGLYRHERRAFLPFLAATPFLFLLGAGFVFYIMLPNAIRFFAAFQTPGTPGTLGIQLQTKVSEYLDFVMTLIFAFGLCFQLPVILSLLARVGIISAEQLRSARRYAIVGLSAVAAVLTPPDIVSMLSLAIPLVILYEISIYCVVLIQRSRTAT